MSEPASANGAARGSGLSHGVTTEARGKQMWRVLIDTNVWIDISSIYKEQVLLDVLEDLMRRNTIQLILPRVVVDEYAANRLTTVKLGAQRTSSVLASARMAIRAVSDTKENQQLKSLLVRPIVCCNVWQKRQ